MTVNDLADKLGLVFLTGQEDAQKQVSGCYCGDLLSFVMSRAKSGDAWLTVMGHLNSVGVAALADLACIILTENAPLSPDALERARQNKVIILQTEKTTFECAVAIAAFLKI
ncbi:MAG: hypothetical protein GX345_06945 [Clostridiales bacterium]|nr:hypothetical protein [Clostridiales bacterium]